MLYDALAELNHAGRVGIIKKVCDISPFKNRRLLRLRKLHGVLDVARFKEIGIVINETVGDQLDFLVQICLDEAHQVDWEESAHAARVCVRPHVDESLDKIKHIYHGIDAVLSKVAEQMWDVIPEDYVPSLNVVYFPQLGLLLFSPLPS